MMVSPSQDPPQPNCTHASNDSTNSTSQPTQNPPETETPMARPPADNPLQYIHKQHAAPRRLPHPSRFLNKFTISNMRSTNYQAIENAQRIYSISFWTGIIGGTVVGVQAARRGRLRTKGQAIAACTLGFLGGLTGETYGFERMESIIESVHSDPELNRKLKQDMEQEVLEQTGKSLLKDEIPLDRVVVLARMTPGVHEVINKDIQVSSPSWQAQVQRPSATIRDLVQHMPVYYIDTDAFQDCALSALTITPQKEEQKLISKAYNQPLLVAAISTLAFMGLGFAVAKQYNLQKSKKWGAVLAGGVLGLPITSYFATTRYWQIVNQLKERGGTVDYLQKCCEAKVLESFGELVDMKIPSYDASTKMDQKKETKGKSSKDKIVLL